MGENSFEKGRLGAAVAGLATFVLLGLGVAAPASAEPQSWPFAYTGEAETFIVPPEVHELSMIAIGGAGGTSSSAQLGGAGGISGMAYGRFAVTPGEALTIWVGHGGKPQLGEPGIAWGYGCGATGGGGEGIVSENGAGGGGASAVTRGETEEPGVNDCFSTRGEPLLVGGGGGGGGANHLIRPPHGGISHGGAGGNGGSPAGKGGAGGEQSDGGCGGCMPTRNGGLGASVEFQGAGAGGGGGGYVGGHGGGAEAQNGGGAGGGGTSYISPGAEEDGILPGYGSGDGWVLLSAFDTETYAGCTGAPHATAIPEDIGKLVIEAIGGHGGSRGEALSGLGGYAGAAEAVLPVEGGDPVDVYVGCQGTGGTGWGLGSGGAGGQGHYKAVNGAGGGGSSGVVVGTDTVLIAGGGGGGGGNGADILESGSGNGRAGGGGGNGGAPGGRGADGKEVPGAGGKGGEGGAVSGSGSGHAGGDAHDATHGGGGGGGGAGWFGGGGGQPGGYEWDGEGGGGGGGGGGMSGVHDTATSAEFGTSNLSGDGMVRLTFLPGEPAAIVAHGGSKQTTTVGSQFAAPLAALVTEAQSKPVAGAEVVFSLPASGASGTFAGGGITETVATGPNGVATSSPVTADMTAGAWEASAAVASVEEPAGFSLGNEAAPTATAVTASLDPATPTEEVTFTAVVKAAPSSAGTPGGTVQFKVDGANLGTPVALSDGSAVSPPATGLTPGDRTIEAVYSGAPSYLDSTGSLKLPVEKTATATHVTSSLNPALPTENVTFTAAVSVPTGNDPYAGTVQFSVDGVPLGAPQAATNGTATSPAYSTAAIGKRDVVATTAETTSYRGSKGEMTEVVDPDGVAVDVTASANPSEYGAPLTLTAEVQPRPPVSLTPTGSVAFDVEGEGCSGTLTSGSASCSPPTISPGPRQVDADYGGDADFEPSDGALALEVLKATTTTSVEAIPASSIFGTPVSFSATVARANPGSGSPSGTVRFELDGEPLGPPVPLEGDTATTTPLTPEAGPHVINATYEGNMDFIASYGATPYVADPAPTAIALSAAPEPSQPDQPVTFTARVELDDDQVPAPSVPSGAVQFRVDGIDFGDPVPLDLDLGVAVSPPHQSFKPGRHDIAALYEPADGNYEPSQTTIVHAVDQPTVTVVGSSRNPSPPGDRVTVAAHVSPLARGGSISFQLDGAPVPGCQNVEVVQNDATCALPARGAGTYEVGAAYSGAPLFDPSQGRLVQEVEGPPEGEKAADPPPQCQLRRVRGRLLVFHNRDAIRLASRYRTRTPGKVTIRFFAREGPSEAGRLLGTLRHRFDKRGRDRIVEKLPAGQMRELRRQGQGFIARFKMNGDPGYCARAFDKDLSVRRVVDGQSVWFQSDSGHGELPPESRRNR
jgi:hypothetical protein